MECTIGEPSAHGCHQLFGGFHTDTHTQTQTQIKYKNTGGLHSGCSRCRSATRHQVRKDCGRDKFTSTPNALCLRLMSRVRDDGDKWACGCVCRDESHIYTYESVGIYVYDYF